MNKPSSDQNTHPRLENKFWSEGCMCHCGSLSVVKFFRSGKITTLGPLLLFEYGSYVMGIEILLILDKNSSNRDIRPVNPSKSYKIGMLCRISKTFSSLVKFLVASDIGFVI